MKTLPDPRERPWLTVAELAEISGEGEKAIRAAIGAGQLPVLHIGRYVRIPTAALLQQLGLPPDSEAGSSTEPTSTTSTPRQEIRHAQNAPAHLEQSRNVHPIHGL